MIRNYVLLFLVSISATIVFSREPFGPGSVVSVPNNSSSRTVKSIDFIRPGFQIVSLIQPTTESVIGWYSYQLKWLNTNEYVDRMINPNPFFIPGGVVITPDGNYFVIEEIAGDNSLNLCFIGNTPTGSNTIHTWDARVLRAYHDFKDRLSEEERYNVRSQLEQYQYRKLNMHSLPSQVNDIISEGTNAKKQYRKPSFAAIQVKNESNSSIDAWEYIQSFGGVDLIDRSIKSHFEYIPDERLRAIEDEILTNAIKPEGGSSKLLGPSGVGKSYLISRLVARIKSGDVPNKLADYLLVEINASDFDSVKYIGAVQARMNAIRELSHHTKIIWIIDEAHDLSAVGKHSENPNNALQSVKKDLASGQLKMLALSTPEEWSRAFDLDPALNRRFARVDFSEPEGDDLIKILKSWIHSHHFPEVTDEFIKETIRISDEFSYEASQPSRATDLLSTLYGIKEFNNEADQPATVQDLTRASIKMYHIDPAELNYESRMLKLNKIEENLKNLIGQEQAKKVLLDKARSVYTGMHDRKKPRYRLLMAGPKGQGKTEIIKIFSEAAGLPKENRIMMSQYTYPYQVDDFKREIAKLIQKNPFTIIFLDELEKSHIDIQNAALAILDEGILSYSTSQGSSKGVKIIRLKNAAIFAATNAGQSYIKEISPKEYNEKEMRIAMVRDGLSEFVVDRFDQIAPFFYLTEPEFQDVLKLHINKTIAEIERNTKLKIQLSPEDLQKMVKHLSEIHFKPRMSNREATRLISTEIENAVSSILSKKQALPTHLNLTFSCANSLKELL